MIKDKNKDYVKEILYALLKKYYERIVKYGQIKTTKRIQLKVTELYRDYAKYNADLYLKMQVNDAAQKLKKMQYIEVDYLLYSEDIIKIYLIDDMIPDMEDYLENHYGIAARYYLVQELRRLIKDYQGKGHLTSFYCDKLNAFIERSTAEIDIKKEHEILQMLAFIQDNDRDLYVREVSMLVYGTSKYFEEYRYDGICNIVREAAGGELEPHELNNEILREYHISNVEQEICIKGDYTIELNDYILETKHFQGGISLSSKDISAVKSIIAKTQNILTIENKTAFYRFDHKDYSTMYLGGYANRHQTAFLKKLYADNPLLNYFHFGDIDVGGFLIHQHLSDVTKIRFQLFCMGVKELNTSEYRNCLVKLTDHDMERIGVLKTNPEYKEVIEEMLRRKVKLEQEIICCTIV